MVHLRKHPPASPFIRWVWRPLTLTGAGGTALALWLDDLVMVSQEVLGLIFLPIMAGIIYGLDVFLFKTRLPRRDDLTTPTSPPTTDKD